MENSKQRDDAVTEAFCHFAATLSAAEYEMFRRLIAEQDEAWVKASDAMHKLLRTITAANATHASLLKAPEPESEAIEPEPLRDEGVLRTLKLKSAEELN